MPRFIRKVAKHLTRKLLQPIGVSPYTEKRGLIVTGSRTGKSEGAVSFNAFEASRNAKSKTVPRPQARSQIYCELVQNPGRERCLPTASEYAWSVVGLSPTVHRMVIRDSASGGLRQKCASISAMLLIRRPSLPRSPGRIQPASVVPPTSSGSENH